MIGTSCESTNASADEEEINGFGLKVFKHTYPRPTRLNLNQFTTNWLLFHPSEELKQSRNDQRDLISLENHDITLAFGSLTSPYRFKCADQKFLFQTNNRSICKLVFEKHNSFLAINIGRVRFTLKRDHIDSHRGVIIESQSIYNIIVHVCLRGNLDEYELRNRGNGMRLLFTKKGLQSCVFFFLSIK